MSRIRADRLVDRAATGAPVFPNGIVITGVATAISFDGSTSSGLATGLTGTPNITVGFITATGDVSVGGTLTYQDVTNVDSVGIITARNGLDLSGFLREKVNVTAGKLSDNSVINVDNGMIHLFTTQETTTSVPNIISTAGINTSMGIGEAMSVTIVTTAASGGYSTGIEIDGVAVTENWTGGSAPSDGGASGVDIYAYTIMKTADATYTVVGTQTKTS